MGWSFWLDQQIIEVYYLSVLSGFSGKGVDMKSKGVLSVAFLVLVALVLPGFLGAETLYVTAKLGTLYETANVAGAKVATLKQGEALDVLETQDKWYRVKSAGATGWISKLFVGANTAIDHKDVASDMSNLSTVATRARASAYTTAAAATRGLSADNVRQRENLAFSAYDFTIAPWLSTFSFPEGELIAFAENEGLVP
jgi:hypothetical protein